MVDTTKNKKHKCPDCYRKTYMLYDLGEVCDCCGGVIGTTYWFQSQHQFDGKGMGKWQLCDEETAIKMACKGYRVKKRVENENVV